MPLSALPQDDAYSIETELSPTDFLLRTPPPVLNLLAQSAPFIKFLTDIVQAVTWSQSNPWASWLTLVFWWTVCLLGDSLGKYALNGIILICLAAGYLTRSVGTVRQAAFDPTITPEKLQVVLEDARILSTSLRLLIDSVLSPLQEILCWQDYDRSLAVCYYLLTSYPLYLTFTYYCGLRYLLLMLGSALLLWRAKWFSLLVQACQESLLVRWVGSCLHSAFLLGGKQAYLLFRSFNSGRNLFMTNYLPGTSSECALEEVRGSEIAFEHRSVYDNESERPQGLDSSVYDITDSSVIFSFTIFENQRWWLGIDYTQALLPNERPPW